MYEMLTSYIYTGKIPPKVEVVSYLNIDLPLKKYRKSIFLQRCYSNALKIALKFPEVEYVEGEILCGGIVPIIHAWNCYQGKHFDLTYEFNKNDSFLDPHYPSIQGTHQQLIEQGYKFDHYLDLFTQYLNRPETNAGNPESPWAKMIASHHEETALI